jgi:hypothetical protein
MWMYYGNRDASAGQDASAAWSGSYASVWHLSETSPESFRDSTGNGNTLTSKGAIAETQLVDGQVSGSLDLDGMDDYLSGANSSSLDISGDMTLMAWVYVDSWNESFPRIIHYHSSSELYVLALSGDNGTSNEARSFWAGRDNLDATALPDSISLDTWTHVTGVFDSALGTWTLYKDGVSVTTGDAGNISSNTQQLSIGVRDGLTPRWRLDGILDEVRIVAAARSADWVSAQHASMLDSFLIYGSEEEL